MSVAEISKLSLEEKLQLLEALWTDLRPRFDELELSPEQRRLLEARRERVRTGAAQLHDWDAVKHSLGR
jgi:putative addiction module component (TIGR02574 family)